MFLEQQTMQQVNKYIDMIKMMGSLSNLFSENDKPYLDSRVSEKLFCMCLNARDVSRSDCTADAVKGQIGIGIKTFLNAANGVSMQKISEFNRLRPTYENLSPEETIHAISNYRNERIDFTKRTHGLNEMIYHCTIRDVGRIYVVESPLINIDINRINVEPNIVRNVIRFTDGLEEYSFNLSKSVLMKRFHTMNVLHDIGINIITDPYSLLMDYLSHADELQNTAQVPEYPSVYLPLYSRRGGIKSVPEASGLNQWNASGRTRHTDELYIPVPIEIHRKYPGFFPPRDAIFNLHLPDETILSAKMCQAASNHDPALGKGLMSNPNKELGKWLLRHVMQVPERELLTMETLNRLEIDSVIVYKIDDDNYSIDFAETDSYENFISGEENV